MGQYTPISAILPNYNYARFISARLGEVLGQSYPINEIIILDDASTDNSVNIIDNEIARIKKERPELKIKFIKNNKNSGSVFAQWQKGIKEATGDFVWIAELDDTCSKNFLETALAPMVKDKTIVLSYTGSKLIGSVSKKDSIRQKLEFVRKKHLDKAYVVNGKTELNKNLAVYNSIPNVSACVFRNIPKLIEMLEEAKEYKLSGDWYFYTRLAEIGKIAYSPKKINSHRLSKNSVTARTKLEDRFLEIQKIHEDLFKKSYISNTTKRRMKKLEEKLRRSWHIS